MTHHIIDDAHLFKWNLLKAYLVEVKGGVAVRFWVPGVGWHFAKYDRGAGLQPDGPCDPLVILEIIRAL